MITVNQADQIIAGQIRPLAAQLRPLHACYGAVLQENVVADRDQPPFDKALVDGIAISLQAWQNGLLTIEGTQAAGQKALRLKNKENGCIKIMTGAVVPRDCDGVVPVEMLSITGPQVKINGDDFRPGQYIRRQGSDCPKGQLLLKAGIQLLPPHIATAASVGKSKLKVTSRPKVAIISNGDELVDINRKSIKPFQIRKSNSFALDAILRQTGLCEPKIFHFPDNKSILRTGIKKILTGFDILVLSGGVSMGEFDYIPQVLKELEVEVLFHKVSQKPGKPFWFGKSQKGRLVFALPGNPVSTQICAYRYVVPYLRRAAGLEVKTPYAVLDRDYVSPTDFTYFLPAQMSYNKDGIISVGPVETGGSGDYAALTHADGFVELAANQKNFSKGQAVPFYPWK
jgi:molybdopterin molybdotransferase